MSTTDNATRIAVATSHREAACAAASDTAARAVVFLREHATWAHASIEACEEASRLWGAAAQEADPWEADHYAHLALIASDTASARVTAQAVTLANRAAHAARSAAYHAKAVSISLRESVDQPRRREEYLKAAADALDWAEKFTISAQRWAVVPPPNVDRPGYLWMRRG